MRVAPRRALLAGAITASLGAAATLPFLASADTGPDLVKVAAVTGGGTPIPGQYIVTMKGGASPVDASRQVSANAKHFTGAVNAFAAKLDARQLDRLRRDQRVAAIEPDQIYKADTVQRSPLPWGLDRIDQRTGRNKAYSYGWKGTGVTAYVIDSGIAANHPQFGGRAASVWVAPSLGGNGGDCAGHGTHVAGTIGSKLHGVAKNVRIRSLRVLDCEGNGSLSDVLGAINWLRTHAQRPAVANLSLGGGKSNALNTALTNLSKSRVFVSVSAGNENQNACNTSPASAGWVEAVGATTVYDNRAGFSNHGKCVDIFAPGYGITSTWPGGGQRSLSGTSMASPHVAGVAALILSKWPNSTFPQVQKWLSDYSTKNRIGKLPRGTANKMLYKANL
ncbi:S8 family peptidase [Actinomadura hibisca]|uniref:S8 family peptidase n=1 Tax=Actinomadura hibisca TaxID=68565 RepID=UPI0008368D2E|nr:S8 family peptidase [Actinomadura hibisca]